jgi:hypothetical protein
MREVGALGRTTASVQDDGARDSSGHGGCDETTDDPEARHAGQAH